ncbi:MAG: DUF4256 domain-containing protein [Candidatus Thorarchaeota archaeon]
MTSQKKELSSKQREDLLNTLQSRFEKNMNRHKGLEWTKVQTKLHSSSDKLWSLNEMERTGGEPDVISYDKKTDEYIFYDCSAQSPEGRRYVCYDRKGQEVKQKQKSTKSVKSGGLAGNAIDMATTMGVELLTEKGYRELQKHGDFDTTTSSWVQTPPDVRELGGALFCDRRYGKVFVYHNSAPSYYGVRGFRSSLRV